ncbi:MAG: glycosyltransferase family 4 protein [Phormidesmis sp.]
MSLALAIARNAANHEVWILLNDRFPESVPAARQAFSGLIPRQRIVVFSIPSEVSELNSHKLWLARASEQVREFFVATLHPDIIHISSMFEGWADDVVTSIGGLPDVSLPTSVTLYDLIPLLKPEIYLPTKPLKDYYFRKVESLKRSSLLLAISESSYQEVVDTLDIFPSKVINISAAADQRFTPQRLTDIERQKIFQQYGIQQPFLMYAPGGFDQRKNIQRLIQAYAKLDTATRQQHQLLITGKLPPEIGSDIRQWADLQRLKNHELILTDYVSDDDLTALYSLCKLFIFPSIHEGFGLPALEAMSCGAAVIGSNVSSIPEVIGRRDALFDPYSVEDIFRAMSYGLSNQQFRESLRQDALIQSAKFSWDNSAKIPIQAFEDLALETHQKAGKLSQRASDEQLYSHLISELSHIPKLSTQADSELVGLATSIATNAGFKQRQLLVDISQLVMLDAKTGIQRVVRSILMGLLENPPSPYEVVPVYWDGTDYRQARQFISKLLPDLFSSAAVSAIDRIVDIACNDIFLGLDLTAHLAPNTQTILERFRNLGVEIYFVVYDILLIDHPEWWPGDFGITFQRWLEIISELSTGLVCISQATAESVKDWLVYFPPERVDYLAINHFHLGADIDKSVPTGGLPEDSADVLAALQSLPTVLMVGTVEPRKGHAQALNAFDLLWQSDVEVNLVIVGQHGWDVEDLVKRLNTHPELGQRLFWLKGISDEYLSKVYSASTVLLAASLGEGFGLPLIEAAQRQLPIIARDLPVFREVAGNCAFYFDGEQPEQLAAAVEKWLALYRKGDIPRSTEMPWLTWAESTQQLLNAILP